MHYAGRSKETSEPVEVSQGGSASYELPDQETAPINVLEIMEHDCEEGQLANDYNSVEVRIY